METQNPYGLTHNPDQIFIFTAEIPDGKDSLLARYFRFSGAFTPLILMIVSGLGLFFWEKVHLTWLSCLIILVPLNFWIFHQLLVKMLMTGQLGREKTSQLVITPQFIGAEYQDGEKFYYKYDEIAKLKLIYGGYEQSWIPFRFRQKGTEPNEVSFFHKSRNVRIPFRLYTQAGFAFLQNVCMMWQEEGVIFEEYNATSGLPLKSYRLEITEEKFSA